MRPGGEGNRGEKKTNTREKLEKRRQVPRLRKEQPLSKQGTNKNGLWKKAETPGKAGNCVVGRRQAKKVTHCAQGGKGGNVCVPLEKPVTIGE